MRSIASVLLVACGAPAPAPVAPTKPEPVAAPAPKKHLVDKVAVDPIAALAPNDEKASYLVPGRVQIELGGPSIEGPGGTRPIQVSLIDEQGNLVRAAVRLEHARFSLWTDRARLLGVIARDVQIAPTFYRANNENHVTLHDGAVVFRLQHRDKRTQVRYVGALEVEGWVGDEDLADEGIPREHAIRFPRPTRLHPQHVFPGAVMRDEPRWAAEQLAVVANAYMLDTVEEVDQAWVVAAYDDTDVSVQGFVSRQDPPGRVHRPRDPDVAPQTITANGRVPSGTCLYTKVKGDPVGYVVGDQDVALDDIGGGWWTLTIDSPWGPLPFSAQGPTRIDLAGCAPAGSVPPSTLNAPPPTPPQP